MNLKGLETLAKETQGKFDSNDDDYDVMQMWAWRVAMTPQTILDMIALIRQLEHAIRVNQRYDDPDLIREALNALKDFDK